MSTYHENLRTAVTATLQEQELVIRQAEAGCQAAAYTLYYSQGALLAAIDRFDSSVHSVLKQKTPVKVAADDVANIAHKVALAANQAASSGKVAVTDAAVSASNLQVATNAVVRLASDIGSIFSMVQAEDTQSSLFNLARSAYELMNKTAFDLEEATRLAMEVSAQAAEISLPELSTGAKGIKESADSFLATAQAELGAATTAMLSASSAVSEATGKEKLAEGMYETTLAQVYAAREGYLQANRLLNQELSVTVTQLPAGPDATTAPAQGAWTITVRAAPLRFPFPDQPRATPELVASYYVVFVREDRTSVFNLDLAERLYEEIPAAQAKWKIEGDHLVFSIPYQEATDADRLPLERGLPYVAFLVARYSPEYQREVNDFEDYLSAPSRNFVVQEQLPVVNASAVSISIGSSERLSTTLFDGHPAVFSSLQDVEYRLLLLPLDGEDNAKPGRPLLLGNARQEWLEELLAWHVGKESGTDPSASPAHKRAQSTTKNGKHPASPKSNPATHAAEGLGFLFNEAIAEQVPAGSYSRLIPEPAPHPNSTTSLLRLTITDATTDIFGHPLVENKKYVPVVLTLFSGEAEKKPAYAPALSEVQPGAAFVFPGFNNPTPEKHKP